MALIEYTLDGTRDKVKTAIERIKMYDPVANGWNDDPYYVAYSGGKDSDCIRILCDLAGVKHELWHNHTTVDAPETVQYVRSIVPRERINMPEHTMWQLILLKKSPPTRLKRFCCSVLKERGGDGRLVMTGVRWAESQRRKAMRGVSEVQHRDYRKSLILNNDNDEARRTFETCQIKGKRIVNPIIDWSDEDVWEFLGHHSCKSNPLYECGFPRVGCIGCPLTSPAKMEFEFQRYPQYKNNYIRTFDQLVKILAEGRPDWPMTWKSGEDVFDWMISGKGRQDNSLQISLEDEDE